MTKRLLWLAVALLLLAPLASAHAAPLPRTFETRLMHDCVDDLGHGLSTGYDVHSLDIWEFWDGAEETVGFRLILSGNGEATITLSFDQGGESQVFAWSGSGDSWTATGFSHAERRDDVYLDADPEPVQDGERFALIGHVRHADLGGEGAVLSGFQVESDASFGDDSMPGNDGAGPCESAFERPDYMLGEQDVEGGYLGKVPDASDVTLLAAEEYFFDVTIGNKISDLKQRVTMEILDSTGSATVQFHEPGGDYANTVDIELNSRNANVGSERLIHLALNAPEGASGTVSISFTTQVVLKDGTTQPGGHAVRTISYAVEDDASTSATQPATTPTDDEVDTPAPSIALASVALLAAALWRRR